MSETTRFTLANGLKVIHRRDSATAMAAVTVIYNVGSRDESDNLTGIAHLFEHLMFGGSVNVADFDGALSAAGGSSNAWTSVDHTCFYDILPAVNIDTALWLESDRMLRMGFSPHVLKVQKSVVIEEFKQTCLNRPYGKCDHAMRSMAWKVHPYSHPVIGKDFSHIERVTDADVREWFYNHYSPQNAVLAVCGNIDADTVRQKVEHWFADIPSRKVAERCLPIEPLVDAPRLTEIYDDVPATSLQILWPMAAYDAPGYYEADLITDILANGNDSRFYKRLLLGTDLFSEIDASIMGCEDPGVLMVNARLNQSTPEAEQRAISAIKSQIELLAAEPVAERELQRCINRLEATRVMGQVNYASLSMALAFAEIHGKDLDKAMEPYRGISTDMIQSAAKEIFNPNRQMTLICRPNSAK